VKYRILRSICEVFEVEADSLDNAINKIAAGEVEESEGLEDRYELIEEMK